jgi:hypothetical protein
MTGGHCRDCRTMTSRWRWRPGVHAASENSIDFITLSAQLAVGVDRDKFELHLRNVLNQQFGTGFVTSKIVIQFHEVADKEVCQIEVSPAKEPVIVTMKDKNGQSTEKFYARSGNSSQEIPLSEMSTYIKERFRS